MLIENNVSWNGDFYPPTTDSALLQEVNFSVALQHTIRKGRWNWYQPWRINDLCRAKRVNNVIGDATRLSRALPYDALSAVNSKACSDHISTTWRFTRCTVTVSNWTIRPQCGSNIWKIKQRNRTLRLLYNLSNFIWYLFV